jgi:hypothetical protein
MNKLPDVCKDCAEYGSDFCKDCLDELNQNLNPEEKILLNTALKNIAKLDNVQNKTLERTDTKNSQVQ